jgi:4-diphosphocytidyl-2C-methyl-D-erythritol kinase
MHPTPASRGAVVLDAPALGTWGSIGRLGGNDFELPVFGRHPQLRALFERVAATHPYWVRMSGSGSAVAAVYASERGRDDAAMQLGTQHQQLIKTSTRALAAPGPETHN